MPMDPIQQRSRTENYNNFFQSKTNSKGKGSDTPRELNANGLLGVASITEELTEVTPSVQQRGSGNGKVSLPRLLCSLLLLQQVRPVASFPIDNVEPEIFIPPYASNATDLILHRPITPPSNTVNHSVYPQIFQQHHHQSESMIRARRNTNPFKASENTRDIASNVITKRDLTNETLVGTASQEDVEPIDLGSRLLDTLGDTKIIIQNRNLLEQGKEAIETFYKDYEGFFLSVRALAKYVANERIKEKFGIDINPDETYFLKFNSAISCPDSYTGWCHDEKPYSNQTLTDYLFTNFSALEREHQIDLDSIAGVYNAAQRATDDFTAKNQIRILPDQFLDLIRDTNFYNIAERTYRTIYARKELHVKKKVMDFFMHLATAKPDSEIVNDLLAGVGLTKKNDVFVSNFEIKRIKAANMFVFVNSDSQKTTLYMPNHPSKFIDFESVHDMRLWIIRNSAHQENREVIASHFSLKDRQNGIIRDGIDSWLNTFKNEVYAEEHVDDICERFTHIPPESFFESMVNSESERFFNDLHATIKSNAEVIRDMIEMDIDAGGFLPNPVTPFLSFAIHVEHFFDSDSELERNEELSKIKADAINFVLMVVTDKVISINAEGYGFIDDVKEGLATGFNEEYLERFRAVKQISYKDVFKKFSVATPHAESSIMVSRPLLDVVKDLPALNPDDFSAVEPNEYGICKLEHIGTKETTMALSIDGKLCQLKPGSFENAFVLDSGNEIVLLDDTYHLRSVNSEDVVTYMPCRSRRSPNNACVYFSQKLNDILFQNIHDSESIQEMGVVRQHQEYASLLINNKGDSYIKFHDFFFKVQKKGMSFVVYAKKQGTLLGRLTGRKVITKFEFSQKKGVMYLTSPAENVVEALGLSDAQAKAVYLPVEMGDQFLAITNEEKKIMRAYGATGYDAINEFLEQGMPTGLYPEMFEKSYTHAITTIRNLLKKLPNYAGVVHRGGMIENDVFRSMHPGDLISHKKFLSCSTDEMVARNFKVQHGESGMLYKINLTKSGHAVSKYTLRYREAEILVEEKTVYRVVSVHPDLIELEEVTGLPGVEANYIRYIKM